MNELDFTVDHSNDAATVVVSAVFYIILALFELAKTAKDYFIQSHELRYEARNIEKYVSEYPFLQSEKLNTLKDISDFIGKTKSEIAALEQERNNADNKRRRASPEDKQKYKDERKALTEKIKPLRDKLKQAEEIFDKSSRLFDLLKEERNLEKSALERSRYR